MIVEIENELFFRIQDILEKRNIGIYKKFCEIKQINTSYDDILEKARLIKTKRKKNQIRLAIKELIHQKIKPTKYKVCKKTTVSYATLNKYFDEIFDEVLKEIKS